VIREVVTDDCTEQVGKAGLHRRLLGGGGETSSP
jgi:hypothetical protein